MHALPSLTVQGSRHFGHSNRTRAPPTRSDLHSQASLGP
jgi:hypothetical protein